MGYSIYIANSYNYLSIFQKNITRQIIDLSLDYNKDDFIILDIIDSEVNNDGFQPVMNTLSWGNAYAYDFMIGKRHKNLGDNQYKPIIIAIISNNANLKYENGLVNVINYGYPDFGNREYHINPENIIYLKILSNGKVEREKSLPNIFVNENISLKKAGGKINKIDTKLFDYIYGNIK